MLQKAAVGKTAGTLTQVKAVTPNYMNSHCTARYSLKQNKTKKSVSLKNALDEALNLTSFMILIKYSSFSCRRNLSSPPPVLFSYTNNPSGF